MAEKKYISNMQLNNENNSLFFPKSVLQIFNIFLCILKLDISQM